MTHHNGFTRRRPRPDVPAVGTAFVDTRGECPPLPHNRPDTRPNAPARVPPAKHRMRPVPGERPPTVGDLVLFVDSDGERVPASVKKIHTDPYRITLIFPLRCGGVGLRGSVPHDPEWAPRTWDWFPPRPTDE